VVERNGQRADPAGAPPTARVDDGHIELDEAGHRVRRAGRVLLAGGFAALGTHGVRLVEAYRVGVVGQAAEALGG
jgi:hypothetical protein